MSKKLPPVNWKKKEILIKLSILLLKTVVEIVARAVRHEKENYEGFPGGAVVENLPANAGDTGSSPGLRRSHMPQRN